MQVFTAAPLALPPHPQVWSTWARFKMDVDQAKVEAYANEIASRAFPRSHLEVDDRWSPKCNVSPGLLNSYSSTLAGLSQISRHTGLELVSGPCRPCKLDPTLPSLEA